MKLSVAQFLNRGEIIIHIKTGKAYNFKKMIGQYKLQTECGREFRIEEVKSAYCDHLPRGY